MQPEDEAELGPEVGLVLGLGGAQQEARGRQLGAVEDEGEMVPAAQGKALGAVFAGAALVQGQEGPLVGAQARSGGQVVPRERQLVGAVVVEVEVKPEQFGARGGHVGQFDAHGLEAECGYGAPIHGHNSSRTGRGCASDAAAGSNRLSVG